MHQFTDSASVGRAYVASIAEQTDSGQDRLAVVELPDAAVLIVADGAGGTSGGSEAAQQAVDTLSRHARDPHGPTDPASWSQALAALDAELRDNPFAGETTGVVACCRDGEVFGASVGDSGAWLVSPDGIVDLTEHQCRKPLLGSGEAFPVQFGHVALTGRLLVASDGPFKYAARNVIARVVLEGSVNEAVKGLVECVKLPSGKLQDDVAVIACAIGPETG